MNHPLTKPLNWGESGRSQLLSVGSGTLPSSRSSGRTAQYVAGTVLPGRICVEAWTCSGLSIFLHASVALGIVLPVVVEAALVLIVTLRIAKPVRMEMPLQPEEAQAIIKEVANRKIDHALTAST